MKQQKKLTDWDWTTLVASWRYYEYRSTIASSMFPEEIIERFFSGEYSDESCMRIANQFAKIDHGRNGEEDWHDKLLMNCDIGPWTTFYAFCEAYCNGFTPIKIKNNGKEETFRGFYCRTTGHWHDADMYIKHPHYPVPYLDYEDYTGE